MDVACYIHYGTVNGAFWLLTLSLTTGKVERTLS